MNRTHRLAAGLAAILTVTAGGPLPAVACDPDTMNEQLAELCRSPLGELGAMLSTVKQSSETVAALRQTLEEARAACRDGEFEVGLAKGIRLAREVGRLEARTLARID